jgi:hypothetical protein
MLSDRIGRVIEGYELSTSLFGEPKSKLLLFPRGQFDHPKYGKMTFDDEFFDEVVANYKNKVLGRTEPYIDFDHQKGRAAAWIRELSVDPDGLWASRVDWTPAGETAVRSGEYRYVSPWWGSVSDAANGETYDRVLRGAGLTNVPYLKQLPPVAQDAVLEESEPLVELMLSEFLLAGNPYRAADGTFTDAAHDVGGGGVGGGGGKGGGAGPAAVKVSRSAARGAQIGWDLGRLFGSTKLSGAAATGIGIAAGLGSLAAANPDAAMKVAGLAKALGSRVMRHGPAIAGTVLAGAGMLGLSRVGRPPAPGRQSPAELEVGAAMARQGLLPPAAPGGAPAKPALGALATGKIQNAKAVLREVLSRYRSMPLKPEAPAAPAAPAEPPYTSWVERQIASGEKGSRGTRRLRKGGGVGYQGGRNVRLDDVLATFREFRLADEEDDALEAIDVDAIPDDLAEAILKMLQAYVEREEKALSERLHRTLTGQALADGDPEDEDEEEDEDEDEDEDLESLPNRVRAAWNAMYPMGISMNGARHPYLTKIFEEHVIAEDGERPNTWWQIPWREVGPQIVFDMAARIPVHQVWLPAGATA